MKIYLAIPYTDIEETSFRIANRVAAQLMKDGHVVYSPISHGHAIAIENKLPGSYDFWQKYTASFIEWCEAICLVCINGVENIKGKELIENSTGCQGEIAEARKHGKEIFLLHYHDILENSFCLAEYY